MSFSAHRWNDVVCFAQRAIRLTDYFPPVCVLDQFRPGLPDHNGFVQGTDSKRFLHTISCFPADTLARIQIDTDRQIQPAPTGLDRPDIRSPFLIRSVTAKVVIARIGGDKQRTMGTVCGVGLQRVFLRALRAFARIIPVLFGDDLPECLPHSARHRCAGCQTFGKTAQTG